LYELAANKTPITLLVPASQRPFVDLFDLQSSGHLTVLYLPPNGDDNSTCILIAPEAVVHYASDNATQKGTALEARATRFQALSWHAAGLAADSLIAKEDLVFIRRRGARTLANEDEVLAALRTIRPPLHIAYYFGNESMRDTVALFAGAAAVFGVHGAGLSNTIYCRPETVVMEISFFEGAALNVNQLWRSAHPESLPTLHWYVHALAPGPESLPEWSEHLTKDDLQSARFVRVPPDDLLNVVNVLAGALARKPVTHLS